MVKYYAKSQYFFTLQGTGLDLLSKLFFKNSDIYDL
jgi:hypothetical protein